MKFIISNKSLKGALKKLKDIVPRKATIPVLENILIEAIGSTLTVTATDLEVTVSVELEIDSTLDKPLKALVPFAWLFSISNIEGDLPLRFDFTKKSVLIAGENDVFKQDDLHAVKEYPELPTLPTEAFVSMNNNFIDRLNSALLTCDLKEETRIWPSKIGMEILANSINIASTNSNTLFTYSFPAETVAETEVMVSHKIVKALDGFKETEIYWNEKHLAFKSSNMKVIATRPEGKYVNWRVVIPNVESNLSLNRAELMNALEKAILINAVNCSLHLKYADVSGIRLSAENLDYNRRVDIDFNVHRKYTGEVTSVSINPSKLQDLLLQVDYEHIDFAITEPNKAILLRSETDTAYLGLIMPLMQTE